MGGFSLLFLSQFLGRLLTDKPRAHADETQLIFPKLDYYLANTADWVSFFIQTLLNSRSQFNCFRVQPIQRI